MTHHSDISVVPESAQERSPGRVLVALTIAVLGAVALSWVSRNLTLEPGVVEQSAEQQAALARAADAGADEKDSGEAESGTLESDDTRPTSYTVRRGDFLGRIAKRYDCKVSQLIVANELRNDIIHPGDVLEIPDCDSYDPEVPFTQVATAPSWREVGVDTRTLEDLMRERGFRPPRGFKALVLEVTFDESRSRITRERAYDWRGTSDDEDGWNPASTVKLFAAIAALQRVKDLGLSHHAELTFRGSHRFRTNVRELVEAAIVKSDNIAYNRLVQLASFDRLNGTFFTEENGLADTFLNRAYEQSRWKKLGESASLRSSPELSLVEGAREVHIEEARGKTRARCGRAACTTLQDLAEAMRRLMLQEQLPPEDSFSLQRADLSVLRKAMRAERSRGNEMVDAFARVFHDRPDVRFYSKPGFSGDWFSDNVYIYDPHSRQAWIVTMAGYPGRKSLDDAARVIGEIIASGELAAL